MVATVNLHDIVCECVFGISSSKTKITFYSIYHACLLRLSTMFSTPQSHYVHIKRQKKKKKKTKQNKKKHLQKNEFVDDNDNYSNKNG